jgi:hypothetical protein
MNLMCLWAEKGTHISHNAFNTAQKSVLANNYIVLLPSMIFEEQRVPIYMNRGIAVM